MTRSSLARPWHLLTLVVAAFALILQTILVVRGATVIDTVTLPYSTGVRVVHLVSYFTIQSNALVAVSMVLILLNRTGTEVFRAIRMASLIGITVTGIIAFLLLPPSPAYSTANLLCDRLLHIVVPLLTVVGWAVFGPGGRLGRRDLLPSLAWPVLWLVYTLISGSFTGWYPYPFIDVDDLGLGRVLLNSAIITALFLALASGVLWADRRLGFDRPHAAGQPG